MKQMFDEELRRYDDLLSDDEKELLISYLNEKIAYLKSDLEILRNDANEYSRIMRHLLDKDTVDRIVKRTIKNYVEKLKDENMMFFMLTKGSDKEITRCLDKFDVSFDRYKELKKEYKEEQKVIQDIFKKRNVRLNFDFLKKDPYMTQDEKKEWEEMDEVRKEENKREFIDGVLHDLNCSRNFESNDINYYYRLIEKLKNNAKVNCSDGQELWCLCDNKEHENEHNDLHKGIIERLKEYTAKFNDGEED